MNWKRLTIPLFLSLGVLYFCSLNSISLTDPDEVFYSLTAKEMADTQSFITPVIFGHPQFEKPPLFYWSLMGSFELFGVNPAAARLVPVLCGIIGVLMTFLFCRRVFGDEIAHLSAMVLATSALYLFMSKAVLTDIMLSVFMAAAFYAFYLWVLEGKQFWLNAFAVSAGLAVLTKGPVAITILLLTAVIYLCWLKEFKLLREFALNPWVLIFLGVAVPWYAAVIYKHGRAFIDEFLIHDNWHRVIYAEHKKSDTWFFYPMIMTVGLFPWTFYLLMMGRRWKEFSRECLYFLVWMGVTFLVFQRAHSKLASYILPIVPAMVILLSVSLSSVKAHGRRLKIVASLYGLLGAGVLIAPVFLKGMYPEYFWPQALCAVYLFGLAIIGSSVYLWRGNILKAITAKTFAMVLLFLVASMNIPAFLDHAVSDKYLRKIVHDLGYEGLPIVTNKLYARGIYFYTGNPVVVLDHNQQPFWSPHPIEVISDFSQINAFFQSKDRVMCVVKKRYKENLDQYFKGSRINRLIAQDGGKYVLMSEKIK